MGKPRKVKKKFQYERNRRKEWMKSKQLPQIRNKELKDNWDESKTVQQNLRTMGLSANPNKTLALPKAKDLLVGEVDMDTLHELRMQNQPLKPTKVVKALEDEANAPQEKRMRLSDPEVKYGIYMMEKYGQDYKAMARDHKNYYQDTPKQIKRKIETFKKIPSHYDAYLESKKKKVGEMDVS